MYDQSDYSIAENKHERSKTLSVLKSLRDTYNNDSPVCLELLNNAIRDLEDNKGIGVNPQTYNIIIKALLSYVPEEIKNY